MPFTDLPPDQLRTFRPEVPEPPDFDAFWAETLAESRRLAAPAQLHRVETPVRSLVIEDLTFSGYAGDRVRAWVTRPTAPGPHPVVIEYVGYNGGRGVPGERLHWASAGYVHVVMDTRGQGSGWGSGGDTPDPHGSGASVPGFMTRGILDPREYYYRRVFTDAALLVDVVRGLPDVDPDRVAVTGGSQGGGISLAAAALVPDLRAVLPDVPFLCCFRRSVELAADEPFTEITRYLAVHRDVEEQVFTTLSYFDGVAFSLRATAPALFSVALMDGIVLPSTVYAAFNWYAGLDKEIVVYPFNGHEAGQTHQWLAQAAWLPGRII